MLMATSAVTHNFNPRSREGSDQHDVIVNPQNHISIHAPARGATLSRTPKVTGKGQFQSTLPRGERRYPVLYRIKMWNFNPRSREGSDFLCRLQKFPLEYFNPRSREGSDRICSCGVPDQMRFQSTLPRGERLFIASCFNSSLVYQSTLPRGERRLP